MTALPSAYSGDAWASVPEELPGYRVDEEVDEETVAARARPRGSRMPRGSAGAVQEAHARAEKPPLRETAAQHP
jgi:hypothetical protein